MFPFIWSPIEHQKCYSYKNYVPQKDHSFVKVISATQVRQKTKLMQTMRHSTHMATDTLPAADTKR